MLLALIATTSADVAATSSRLAKVERIAECLREAAPEEISVAVAYLSGELPQGTVGVGWAALREQPASADRATLELLEVDAAVSRLQSIVGKGSQSARREELAELFARATEPEQRLLVGLFLGELRQGALEGVMTDAVAKTAGVPVADVRRAAMLAGDLPSVAEVAMREGTAGLARFRLTPLRAIGPMLAQTAGDVAAGLERLESTYVEWKLDGARIQAHRVGDDIAIFTRNLADITSRVPEIVAAIRCARRLGDRARRRGDRAARRRPPASVSGHDEPLRHEGGRGGCAAARLVLLRLPARGRRRSHRSPGARAARRLSMRDSRWRTSSPAS